MFTVIHRPRDILARFLVASITTTEAMKHEHQREATGATSAPKPTVHSTAYPGGGTSKNTMSVASSISQPARSVRRHENRVMDPKHGGYSQDLDGCIGVAVRGVLGLLPPTQETLGVIAS